MSLIIQRVKNKLFLVLNPWMRQHIILPWRRLCWTKNEITLIANNCIGGCICHDLKLRFNSPFVNLWLYPKDFIKYCENIDHYRNCSLQFLLEESYVLNYPVALLDDIKIYFQHYHSNEEAEKKWVERTKRMDLNNIYCIMVERDGCTEEDLLKLSTLPYPSASLVHTKDFAKLPNAHFVSGFEHEKETGNIMEYASNQFWGRKYYDDFNYVEWLNGKKNSNIRRL